MSLFEAILLGLIQGLTEFLPVSSSGHIELGKAVLGVDSANSLLFSIIVHAATALATLTVFRNVIIDLIRGLFRFKWNEETKFVWNICLSMLPVFIVGFFFKDEVEELFTGKIALVGIMLWVTAVLLFLTTRSKKNEGNVNAGNALIIGIAQAVAVLPGLSRSGATISTALLLGVDKAKAARFSFLMVLPPIFGATLLEIKDVVASPNAMQIETGAMIAGFVAAFIAGFAACRWMIWLVQNASLIYFALYCVIIGAVAIYAGM